MTAAICVAVATAMILIPCLIVASMDAVSQRGKVRALEAEKADLEAERTHAMDGWFRAAERADRADAREDRLLTTLATSTEKSREDSSAARIELAELVKAMVTASQAPAADAGTTGTEPLDMTAMFEDLTDWSDESVPPTDIRQRMPVFDVDE